MIPKENVNMISVSFVFFFLPETLAWRRVADLHVMMATAFGALLGWSLYKHGVTHIFHQEEGRYLTHLCSTNIVTPQNSVSIQNLFHLSLIFILF